MNHYDVLIDKISSLPPASYDFINGVSISKQSVINIILKAKEMEGEQG